jgi:O-Antigen ligase
MPGRPPSPETVVHCYSRGVSTLATAPDRAKPEPAGEASSSGARRVDLIADIVLGVALATGFGLIVFAATGGTDLAPNTWVQIGLIAVGAACALAVILVGARGPAWGAPAVALFAALAALTYISIAWSVQPADSWVEANRTLSYLAAFGAAVALARLVPARWPALVWAVGTVAVVTCGYALLAKVFPATLNAADTLGRLRVPFSYWNATGLMAALGLPACLWAGARSEAGRALRALTVPAIAVLLTVVLLSYSRGALIAAVVGLGCWFVLVPLRLRATLLLALGAIGGALATGWALKHHAITHDGATLAARTSAGHTFGLVLLAVIAAMAAIGFAAAYAIDRIALAEPVRRRIGTALIVLVALVPVAGIAGVAASSRGLTGEVSHVWTELTSPSTPQPGNNPGRIAALGNSRPLYWSEGLKVGEHSLLAGAGAGGFATARTRYSSNSLSVAHAHSYVIETFADFGLIGIAVSLALLVAWWLAAARTLGFSAGPRTRTSADPSATTNRTDERIGLITLLAIVVIFGISSLIDWTWFIPGVAVPALACAGWLAGRGPLDRPVGRAEHRRRLTISPGAGAAAIGILAITIAAGWFVWQPLHSANAFDAAITAMTEHDSAAALADAQSAAASDPVSVEPLWELSEIYSAQGNQTAARQQLMKATTIQPANPETWEQLGEFDLAQHQANLALLELQAAQQLDLGSASLAQQIAAAQRALSASS